MKGKCLSYGTDMGGGGCAIRTHECWLQRPEPYHLANPLCGVPDQNRTGISDLEGR